MLIWEEEPKIVTSAQKKDVKLGNSVYCGNVTGNDPNANQKTIIKKKNGGKT